MTRPFDSDDEANLVRGTLAGWSYSEYEVVVQSDPTLIGARIVGVLPNPGEM